MSTRLEDAALSFIAQRVAMILGDFDKQGWYQDGRVEVAVQRAKAEAVRFSIALESERGV